MKTINNLNYIPRWLGQPQYFGGLPMEPQYFYLGYEEPDKPSKNVLEVYYRDALTKDEFEFCRDYIAYYVYAPVWTHHEPEFEAYIKSIFDIKDHDGLQQFVFGLLDFGLDIL